MPNFGDLIGGLLQNSPAPSGQNRMGNALENLKRQGLGGGDGGLFDGILGAVRGGLNTAAENPLAAGGIGAVLGSLIGGGSDSVKGAIGGGALAMLAGVAMKALTQGGQSPAGTAGFSGGNVPVGLKVPETPGEREALEQTAVLVIKGMINAAKSDGEIGLEEMQRIVGKLKESGMDQGTEHWVMAELSKPPDLNAFVAEIPSPEVAAEVYAASLLAIEVDTEAERAYLQEFAERTGLNPAVVQYINQTMGVA
jgi:uncharacterized membrane protein YebE (DUF533 family)